MINLLPSIFVDQQQLKKVFEMKMFFNAIFIDYFEKNPVLTFLRFCCGWEIGWWWWWWIPGNQVI